MHAEGKSDYEVQMINLLYLGKIKHLFREINCCEQVWAKQVHLRCIKNRKN